MITEATATQYHTDIPAIAVRRGKVRDVYDLGDRLLLVATDRISAYDVVLPTPIPGKGAMLTRLSRFWFSFLDDRVAHHFVDVVTDRAPAGLEPYLDQLRDRATLCRKCAVVPIECVVRGYLAGSGWTEYQRDQRVCGVKLPAGLSQCDELPEPIFTPATKAASGHDENISFEAAGELVGGDVMEVLRQKSLGIYATARDYARRCGIIIADTKFEFGRRNGQYLLIDEVLTPDSSRFWPLDTYQPGRDQDSFDKQYVRNYLTTLVETGTWDKTPPGPDLPDEIVTNTAAKYREACGRLIHES